MQDCREKWRNLRTVFLRKLKPTPIGSRGKRKAYYLENAMQFCVPFIKTMIPFTTGNVPASPNTKQAIDDAEDSKPQVEDSTQSEEEFTNLPQNFLSMSPSTSDESPQQSITPSVSSSSKRTSQIMKRKNQSSAPEYFEIKKAKLPNNPAEDTINQIIDRQQSIKMFLLSLLPELEDLSDTQIKLFKRQVLKVIDDISA